jgi:hypothetical protein
MANEKLENEIRPLVVFEWHEQDGNYYCAAEHRAAYEAVGGAEIVRSELGWRPCVTYPFNERFVESEGIEETKANLERAIVAQLARCTEASYLFADKAVECIWGDGQP